MLNYYEAKYFYKMRVTKIKMFLSEEKNVEQRELFKDMDSFYL